MDTIKDFLKAHMATGATLKEIMDEVAAAANAIETEAKTKDQDKVDRPWAYGGKALLDKLEAIANNRGTIEDGFDVFLFTICGKYPMFAARLDKETVDSAKKAFGELFDSIADLEKISSDDNLSDGDKIIKMLGMLPKIEGIKASKKTDNDDFDVISRFISCL